MNSKQSEAQKNQLRSALGRMPATDEDASTPAAPPLPPRVTPVRITVDMEPDLHRRFKLWAVDAGDARLAEVVRVLIEEMLEKPELAELVHRKVLTRKAR